VFFATPVMRTVARIELPLYQGGDDGDSLPGLQSRSSVRWPWVNST
jgi:hypothetical protein